jgi:hypothetical protein
MVVVGLCSGSDLPRTLITRYPTGFLNLGVLRSFVWSWWGHLDQAYDTTDIAELLPSIGFAFNVF